MTIAGGLRRAALSSLGLIAVAALFSSAAASAQTLKLGEVTWIGYGPLYVAKAEGFFKKHGVIVDPVIFSDNSTMPSALAAGAIQGSALTYDQVINANSKGQNLQVVLPIDYSDGADAIVTTRSITRIKQLKGKRVGYNPLSPSAFLVAYALQQHGLSPRDVTSVSMTPQQVAGAMISGSMKAGATYQPSVSQIVDAKGGHAFHVLYSSRQAPGLITDVLVFKESYIQNHRSNVLNIMRAYMDGLRFMKSNRDQAVDDIANAMKIKPAQVKKQLQGITNPGLKTMPKSLARSKDSHSLYVSGKVISRVFMRNGQFKKMPDLSNTMDASPLQALAGY